MIYYFDSVYVIGGLALLFLILLAFLKFMKRKSNMYLLCFSNLMRESQHGTFFCPCIISLI